MPAAYIDDGYQADARIAAADGLHPEVRFKFRPLTAAEWMKFLSECADKKLDEARTIEARWLAGKVVSWDIRDRAGTLVPITAETFQRLAPAVFKRIANIVTGQDRTDSVDLEAEAKN